VPRIIRFPDASPLRSGIKDGVVGGVDQNGWNSGVETAHFSRIGVLGRIVCDAQKLGHEGAGESEENAQRDRNLK